MFFGNFFDQANPYGVDPLEQQRRRMLAQRQKEEAERRRLAEIRMQREMLLERERQRRAKEEYERAVQQDAARRQQAMEAERQRAVRRQRGAAASSSEESEDEPQQRRLHPLFSSKGAAQQQPVSFFPWGRQNPFGEDPFGTARPTSRMRSATTQRPSCDAPASRPTVATPDQAPTEQPAAKTQSPPATAQEAPCAVPVPEAAASRKSVRVAPTVPAAVKRCAGGKGKGNDAARRSRTLPMPRHGAAVPVSVPVPVPAEDVAQHAPAATRGADVEEGQPCLASASPPPTTTIDADMAPPAPTPPSGPTPPPMPVADEALPSPVTSARSDASLKPEQPAAAPEAASPEAAASLGMIAAIRKKAEDVKAQWGAAAFTPITSEADREKVRKDRAFFEEGLLQQVIRLDSVDTHGDPVVRQARKQAVVDIEASVNELRAFSKGHDYDKKPAADIEMRDDTSSSESVDSEQ